MSDTATVERPAPTNVVQAIARVMEELPGIGKDSQASEGQGNYKYRGIEAITAEIQKLLGRYSVVFVAHEISFQINDLVINNKPWTDTILAIEYDVFGPGGPDDRLPERVGPIHAIGRDNSDKGANKARTQAYKYALLHTFSIGDAKDDADGTTHEADSRAGTSRTTTPAERKQKLADAIKDLDQDDRATVKSFCADNEIPAKPNDWSEEHMVTLRAYVEQLASPPVRESAPEEQAPATNGDEAGGTASPPSVSSPPTHETAAEWDRDSLLGGINAYEERLDETTFPAYTTWLGETFGNGFADIKTLDDADLEQVWQHLEKLITEGVPA